MSCSWVSVCLLVVNLVPPTLSWTMSGEDLARQPGGELLISPASLCNVRKPQLQRVTEGIFTVESLLMT